MFAFLLSTYFLESYKNESYKGKFSDEQKILNEWSI